MMDPQVKAVFDSYPVAPRRRLLALRKTILYIIKELALQNAQETLKWGEPAYLVKGGSTVRLGFKSSSPQRYSIYFNCRTTLLETFREIYSDTFTYDGKRAIHLDVKGDYSKTALRHCIALSLTYHKVKHLPMLGA
jgi:hypothetical protein